MNQKVPVKKKYGRFMEGIWLGIAAVSFITWIIALLKKTGENDLMLLIITGISILMYFLRRYLRKHPMQQKKNTSEH